jgi:carbonic anhydrase/acetyltransferase-like protein (isoleucine patch superfamily)
LRALTAKRNAAACAEPGKPSTNRERSRAFGPAPMQPRTQIHPTPGRFWRDAQATYNSAMPLFTRTSAGVFIAHNATLTGEITIGEDASFWFNAVVRGDVAPIRIGQRVNVQDQAVIHCDTGIENVIEDDVTIGHGAIVHGAFVGRGSLIGMGAKVLGRTKIGSESLIAAGAVVPPGLVVPDRMVVMGVPGKIVRPVKEEELKYMRWLVPHYVELAGKYARGEVGTFKWRNQSDESMTKSQ